jgi:site-specific recombinase XerD
MGVRALAVSFARVQRSEFRSPHTVKLYADCIRRLAVFLEAETGADDVSGLTRRRLTDFYAARSETCAPATVWTDFKCHRVFLRWLVAEDEMASNPMDRMRQPKQPVTPVPVLSDADLHRLVAACEGSGYRERRDMACLRLLMDCGLRRTELATLKVADLDMDQGILTVTGKGKTRVVAFGAKTALALDRWLRLRARHRLAASDALWPDLTPSGLYQALRGRAEGAGVHGWHTHRMRHTFAHQWMLARGNETDLMQVAGWSSVSMLRRYGASAAAERARLSQRKLALGDKY